MCGSVGASCFMIRKLIKDTKAGIEDLIPVAIVITVLIVLFSVIPVIGYNVDSSITIPATSTWNSGVNTAMTNGSELWSTNSPLLSLAVLIGIIFTAIGMLLTGGSSLNRGGGGL